MTASSQIAVQPQTQELALLQARAPLRLKNKGVMSSGGVNIGGSRICWQVKQMPPFLLLLKRTPLIQHLLTKDWDATLQRLKTNPSESKTWVEVELNPALVNAAAAAASTQPLSPSNSESEASNSSGSSDQQHEEADQQRTTLTPAPSTSSTSQTIQINTAKDMQSCKSRLLPLHLATRNGAPLRVIKALVAANRKAVTRPDSFYDRHALHFACLNEPNVEVVSFLLLKSQMNSVCHSDSLSRLPLHYAAFGNADMDVFDALLQAYPKGAEAPEAQGWLPLHVAVKTQCSFTILRRIVESYPASLTKKTNRHSTVFQLARRFHGRSSSMEYQLYALQAAVEAIYDTDRGQLSLLHVSDALWTEQQPPANTAAPVTVEEARADVSTSASDEGTSKNDQDSSSRKDSNTSSEMPQDATTGDANSCVLSEDERFANTKADPEIDPDNCCVVCLEEERTHAFVPCGHLCVCQGCSILSHRPGGMNCPLCRKKSFLVMQVFG
jgi:hypothetical protein